MITDNAGADSSLFAIWVGSGAPLTQVRNLFIKGSSVSDSVFAINDGAHVSFYNVDIVPKSFAGSSNSTITSMNGARNNIGAYDAYCNATLTFEKCDIRPDSISGKRGVQYNAGTSTNAFGGFIGYMAGGSVTMTDCTVGGTMQNGNVTCGGFVGEVAGGTLTMNNCRSEMNPMTEGGKRIAGFVGKVYAGTVNITGSTNSSNIAPPNSFGAGFISDVGDTAKVTLTDCINNGTIKGINGADGGHGGIVGRAHCSTGGVVGMLDNRLKEDSSLSVYPAVKLDSCVNNGTVTLHQHSDLQVTATQTDQNICGAGGLIGELHGISRAEITNSINNGLVTTNIRNTTTAFSLYFLGGFVGFSNSYDTSLTVKNCFNMGLVYSTHNNAGGFGGELNATSVTFENFLNAGTIRVGGGSIGGIGGYVNSNLSTATFQNCANIGKLINDSTNRTGDLFGLEFMSERVGTANPQITVAIPFLRATQKTASADGKFDIRLISTIDSLDYERVGFLVTTKYGTTIEHRPASCRYAFVSDWQNGATLSARDDLCGEYMVILTYENVPASGTVTFTVTPYGF